MKRIKGQGLGSSESWFPYLYKQFPFILDFDESVSQIAQLLYYLLGGYIYVSCNILEMHLFLGNPACGTNEISDFFVEA